MCFLCEQSFPFTPRTTILRVWSRKKLMLKNSLKCMAWQVTQSQCQSEGFFSLFLLVICNLRRMQKSIAYARLNGAINIYHSGRNGVDVMTSTEVMIHLEQHQEIGGNIFCFFRQHNCGYKHILDKIKVRRSDANSTVALNYICGFNGCRWSSDWGKQTARSVNAREIFTDITCRNLTKGRSNVQCVQM